MADDVRIADPFAQPVALTETPTSRLLNRDDLQQMQKALDSCAAAIAAWEARLGPDRRRVNGAAPAEPAHCLVVTGSLGPGYQEPDLTTEDAVARACRRHFTTNPPPDGDGYPEEARTERIHVILDSTGGSLDSAYKVVLYLRTFAKEVRVYVPNRAKSAATLIAVGADRVVMSPFAELGPLDTQIIDPRNPTTRVSALDCYQSVDYVREFGVLTIPRALKVMLDETRTLIPLGQLIESATTFATGSVRPMLEQVTGLDFGAWGRTLKIGETYARMLRLRLRHPDSEEAAERLARQLVYGYPHHPYPIDRAEARSLGITVDTMPTDVYRAADALVGACRGAARFVGFAADVTAAIERMGEPDDSEPRLPAGGPVPAGADGSPQANVVSVDQ
jgi:serine dehydrogenase proteinase